MEWIIVFFVGYIILKAISKDESSHHHSLITKTKQDLEVEFEPNNEIKNKKITNSNKISSKPKKINKNSISRVKITNNQKSVEQSLKTWRKEKSKELAIPCFSILHNSTLKAIVEYLPINKQQLNSVRGVGSKTLDNYGDEILAVLNSKDKDCNQNIDNFNKNITKIND